MRKLAALLLIAMVPFIVWAEGTESTPASVLVTFSTSEISEEDETIRFGFTKTDPTTAESFPSSSETSFVLDTDHKENDPTSLIGVTDADTQLFVYWDILSSKNFEIQISSAVMKNGEISLDFTASATPFTGKTPGQTKASINSSNNYGANENAEEAFYTHAPESNVGTKGGTELTIVTEDAAGLAPGTYKTNITLTFATV